MTNDSSYNNVVVKEHMTAQTTISAPTAAFRDVYINDLTVDTLNVRNSATGIINNSTFQNPLNGDFTATGTITAGTGLTSLTGDVLANGGNLVASGTIAAGNGLSTSSGNISALAGSLTAGTGLTVSSGGLTVSSGDVNVNLGGVIVASGNVTVAGDASASNTITSASGIVAQTGSVQTNIGDINSFSTLTAATDITTTAGDLILNGAGKQLQLHGGAATDFIGIATLTNGNVGISNTNIAATDRVFMQRINVNGSTALGSLAISIVTPGVSFIVNARQFSSPLGPEAGDQSTFVYWIVRQV